MKRGTRNNNPGNLKLTTLAWRGKIPNSENTDGTFEQFESMAYGIRALYRTLITYANKYGLRSVSDIIDRWAPPGENSENARENYKRYIRENFAGRMSTPVDLQNIAAGIMSFENSADDYKNYIQQHEAQAVRISNLEDLKPENEKKKVPVIPFIIGALLLWRSFKRLF